MTDRVLIDIKDHIAHVRLNRPDKINALDDAMFEELGRAGDEIKTNSEVRAVVLSGEGRGFCAGIDLATMSKFGSVGEKPPELVLETRTHGIANRVQYASWVWREAPVPVIAAIHGACLGGGVQIAMGADMRYAHPEAKLAILEMNWGIVPDMAATPFIIKCLRDDVLRELTYTNRTILAPEAQALGLVTKVTDDPLASAFETAGEIAARNPDAVRLAKGILNTAPFSEPSEILLSESRAQDSLIGTPNQMERAMSVMQKRPPVYSKKV